MGGEPWEAAFMGPEPGLFFLLGPLLNRWFPPKYQCAADYTQNCAYDEASQADETQDREDQDEYAPSPRLTCVRQEHH